MGDFYAETILKLIERGILRRNMKLLVVCGGQGDREVLKACGFTDAVISNIDEQPDDREFAPYEWSRQDAEQLDYDDEEFDFCLAHSGLHHCRSPHRALLEMYRVARMGLMVFEPLDTMITRLGVRLGLGQRYEVAAVADSSLKAGGLRNTAIPNYVYRWTEREVEKTIRSFAPIGEPTFLYFYGLRIPWEHSRILRSKFLGAALRLIEAPAKLISTAFPRASNNFAFVVLKPGVPGQLHPWLKQVGDRIELDKDWVRKRYG